MRLGLMSDIHGNRTALDAVLADARHQGVDRWWILGDLVAIGPEPVATLEVVANLPDVAFTRGNTDRYVLRADRATRQATGAQRRPDLLAVFAAVQGSFDWTRAALADGGWIEWLAALPLELQLSLPDGPAVLGVHASPGRDDGEGITPDRPLADLERDLAGADADLVFAGHTHQPTDRQVGDVRAINLGSVSNPVTDDLRASYVILHADRHSHAVEHRRVGYDRDRFLTALERSGHPQSGYIRSFQFGTQVRFPSERPGAPIPSDGQSG